MRADRHLGRFMLKSLAAPLGAAVQRDDMSEMDAETLLASMLLLASSQEAADAAAHCLIHRFGDLTSVMRASSSALGDTAGVNRNMVSTIKGMQASHIHSLRARLNDGRILSRPGLLRDYCAERLQNVSVHTVQVFFLRAGKLVHEGPLERGDITGVNFYTREIIRTAMECDADGVILVFGHPHGDGETTLLEDEEADRLSRAADALSMELHHRIVITK